MTETTRAPLSPERAGELAALHRRCMPSADGWSESGLKRLIEADAAVGIEMRAADGTSVGFVLAFAAADEAEVLAISVAPEHRRKGLGRELLKGLERDLVARGTVHLHLEARASNFAARELYRKAGFGETGRRKGYYAPSLDQPAEDAVLMARTLRPE